MVKYLFLSLFALLAASAMAEEGADWVVLPSGLSYRDDRPGQGEPVAAGRLISVRYQGRFLDGRVFDTSHFATQPPFRFIQGTTRLLPGWTEGMAGMRAGGKRTLNLPPALAYGKGGVKGFIPPNAALVYEVEVVGVE